MRKPKDQLKIAEELLGWIQHNQSLSLESIRREIRNYFSDNKRGAVIERLRRKK